MTSLARPIAAALLLAASLCLGGIGIARADRPALMPPVSAAIDRLVEETEDLAACLDRLDNGAASALVLLKEEWTRRRGLWIGTLWATGFGEEEIERLAARLDKARLPPPVPPGPCLDDVARLQSYLNRHPPIDASAVAASGVNWGDVIIDAPDSAERIEAAVTPRLKRWAELLACAMLPAPRMRETMEAFGIAEMTFAIEAHRLRIFLRTRGYPQPRLNRVLARIILQVRWNRPPVTEAGCLALDPDKVERWGGEGAGTELASIAASVLGVSSP
jgi:hypothetical protein